MEVKEEVEEEEGEEEKEDGLGVVDRVGWSW